MWVFALFLAVPLIEIGLFVTVGGWLGLWMTLAIIFATGFLGISILRGQGTRLRGLSAGLHDPLALMADGGLLMLSAILLILPGFLTDSMGVLLLLPPVRRLIILLVGQRLHRSFAAHGGGKTYGDGGGEVIDGTWSEKESHGLPLSGPENRTRH